jgi:hypothetical protein
MMHTLGPSTFEGPEDCVIPVSILLLPIRAALYFAEVTDLPSL